MSDPKAQDDAKSDRYLPYSRIRTIMKSSADPVSLSIKEESLQLVCRATVCKLSSTTMCMCTGTNF